MANEATTPRPQTAPRTTRVTSLSVLPADHDRWKAAAQAEGLNLSAFIARAVEAQLERKAG